MVFCRRLIRRTVVFLFFVAALRAGLPSVEIAQGQTVSVNVVAVMVMDQDRVRADRAQHCHGREGQHKQQPRYRIDDPTHYATSLT